MQNYDPDVAPDSQEWLNLDEGERLLLVQDALRLDMRKDLLMLAKAGMLVTVENQLAMGFEPVLQTLARLQREGLARRDGIFAISSVLANHIEFVLQQAVPLGRDAANARYAQELDKLEARDWREERDLV